MNTKIVLNANGSDLYLNLKTSYVDFYNSEYAEELFDNKVEYSRFKKRMKDKQEIYKHSMLITWSDMENKYLNDNEMSSSGDFSNVFYGKSEKLQMALARYLKNLMGEKNIKRSNNVLRYLKNTDKIINFNYTNSLEKFYGINSEKISYIHGSVYGRLDKNENLVLGLSKDEDKYNLIRRTQIVSKEVNRNLLNFIRWVNRRRKDGRGLNEAEKRLYFVFLNGIHSCIYLNNKSRFKVEKEVPVEIYLNRLDFFIKEQGIASLKKLIRKEEKLNKKYFYTKEYEEWIEKKKIKKISYKLASIARKNLLSSYKEYLYKYEFFDSNKIPKNMKGFINLMVDYFEETRFVPFKIKIGCDIDKIDEIIIIGHSLTPTVIYKDNSSIKDPVRSLDEFENRNFLKEQINKKKIIEERVIDDEELFKELFSGKNLKQINFFYYNKEEIDLDKKYIRNLCKNKKIKINAISYE
ncbi:AbiH family protein [Lactobacillus agrestimuris]|uniref:AbiH family protein n=1 Tax=Lactobacillus agrestimuris TaxID=2941328 RepID=UPI0020445BA9|nr:AbiH family protein [Lactobacillus agrestimuris]